MAASKYRSPESTRQSDFVRLAARWDAAIERMRRQNAEDQRETSAG